MRKTAAVALLAIVVSISAMSFGIKDITGAVAGQSIHHINTRLVGKWMWTKGSSGAYFDNNGVYKGAAYGFAIQYVINANGSGTCFNHVFSKMNIGPALEVNIYYKGFFESDDKGHLGFFPTSGTYKSSSGVNRSLREDELWNTKTNTGRNFLHQNLEFTTEGGRECYQVTDGNGKVDTFFKMDK